MSGASEAKRKWYGLERHTRANVFGRESPHKVRFEAALLAGTAGPVTVPTPLGVIEVEALSRALRIPFNWRELLKIVPSRVACDDIKSSPLSKSIERRVLDM